MANPVTEAVRAYLYKGGEPRLDDVAVAFLSCTDRELAEEFLRDAAEPEDEDDEANALLDVEDLEAAFRRERAALPFLAALEWLSLDAGEDALKQERRDKAYSRKGVTCRLWRRGSGVGFFLASSNWDASRVEEGALLVARVDLSTGEAVSLLPEGK